MEPAAQTVESVLVVNTSYYICWFQVFVGLVVRDHLMVLLRRALARGSTANLEVTYEDLNHQFVTAAARHLIWEQHMAVLQVELPA